MNKLSSLRRAAAADPVLLLFLGACPAMGASADIKSALALGLSVLIISFLTALIIGALKSLLSEGALFCASLIIPAGLASMAQLLVAAFAPGIYPAAALYTAVCAVSLMIYAAAGSGIGKSLSSGLIFLAAILLTALIRELIGSGSIWGIELSGLKDYTVPLLSRTPGGFIVFSLVLALIKLICLRRGKEA